jgi:hypothetical protein
VFKQDRHEFISVKYLKIIRELLRLFPSVESWRKKSINHYNPVICGKIKTLCLSAFVAKNLNHLYEIQINTVKIIISELFTRVR